VITIVAIEKREKFASRHGVDHLIDTRETKRVLRIVFVERSKWLEGG
jgi:NADPH:quinone reductase-like Zn-dependent oxidoreductase